MGNSATFKEVCTTINEWTNGFVDLNLYSQSTLTDTDDIDNSISLTLEVLTDTDLINTISTAYNYFTSNPTVEKYSESTLELVKDNPWIWFTNYCEIYFTPDIVKIIDGYINNQDITVEIDEDEKLRIAYFAIGVYQIFIRKENTLLILNPKYESEIASMGNTLTNLKTFMRENFNLEVESLDRGEMIYLTPDFKKRYFECQLNEAQSYLDRSDSIAILLGNVSLMSEFTDTIDIINKYYDACDKTKSCKIATNKPII